MEGELYSIRSLLRALSIHQFFWMSPPGVCVFRLVPFKATPSLGRRLSFRLDAIFRLWTWSMSTTLLDVYPVIKSSSSHARRTIWNLLIRSLDLCERFGCCCQYPSASRIRFMTTRHCVDMACYQGPRVLHSEAPYYIDYSIHLLGYDSITAW